MAPYKVTTGDGSPTLYSEHYSQHYHNISGALTESRHVFFERTGLLGALSGHRDISVYEVGFGTGFHVLLLEFLRRETGSRSSIRYYSVEKYPVDGGTIRGMGYQELFPGLTPLIEGLAAFGDKLRSARSGDSLTLEIPGSGSGHEPDRGRGPVSGSGHEPDRGRGPVSEIRAGSGPGYEPGPGTAPGPVPGPEPVAVPASRHQEQTKAGLSKTGQVADVMPAIHIQVFRGDFFDQDFTRIQSPIRFFLHDAFSPNVNPELWSPRAFEKLHTIADRQAILGTYASATRARAAMILAGWHVARTAGPPGKREMTLASPGEEPLEGYKRVNEHRLRERFRHAW